MSEDGLSDGMEELQDLIAEYEAKEIKKQAKPKLKNKTRQAESTVMEVPMDKILFGDKAGLLKNLAESVGQVKREIENELPEKKGNKRKPVWSDVDDEELQVADIKRTNKYNAHIQQDIPYKELLKSNFNRFVAQPKWANVELQNTKIAEDSDDEELLRTVGFLSKSTSSNKISPASIDYKPLLDLNRVCYGEGSVTSIKYHPNTTAALVAGSSGVASIYALDGYKNEKLHNIYFGKFPIKCMRISPCGTKAYFAAKKHYYFNYDLLVGTETRFELLQSIKHISNFDLSPCGRYLAFPTLFGHWYLFDAIANELIHSFQQENPVANLIFADSQRIICTSTSSEVYIYSLKQRKLEHKFIDDGCITGNVLDLSVNQQLLATGSAEGAVNVYDYDNVFTTNAPKPEKTFLNLKTGISCVKFNHTSELLAMCSSEVRSAVRIAHFPSATVYANFPQEKDGIGQIGTMEFSPQSGYFAMGGHSKRAQLFRLKHYKNY